MKKFLFLSLLTLSSLSFSQDFTKLKRPVVDIEEIRLNPEVNLIGEQAKALYQALNVQAKGVISIATHAILRKEIPGVECVLITKPRLDSRITSKYSCKIEKELNQEQLAEFFSKLEADGEIEITNTTYTITKNVSTISLQKIEYTTFFGKETYYRLLTNNHAQ